MIRFLALIPVGFLLYLILAAQAPRASLPYRADLIRESRYLYGLDAPVPVFAGQIHQESGWRPDVCSPFACGLTQFTDPTAKWIGEAYPELSEVDVFNPQWAIRAMLRYDRHIYRGLSDVATECDHWAMTLSGYNGGPGWVSRDRRLAENNGANPRRWFGETENWSSRAAWAFRENRGYPRNILLRWQPIYSSWGREVICK